MSKSHHELIPLSIPIRSKSNPRRYSQYVRPLNWKHFVAATADRGTRTAACNLVLTGFPYDFETGGEQKRMVS
ncbi:hypothetical protein [Bradyrhizobium sp.]|uniref:hypothetical protein n=1 Tax=Bradyrhizobium sp. TaxID=376 RepID=UPI00271CBBE4|nr:hypothetical protein [Bradyrhizobium sp.]MDO9299270.1 hypothetical protein [Bradyrhizobium sp.]